MLVMKLTNAMAEDIITELIGADVIPLIRLLKNKKNVSEFKLADMMNITVNQTRNMLYRFYNHNLVTFIRKKDKRKGWYIYYWTLDTDSLKNELVAFKRRKLAEFKARLGKETEGSHLVCPTGCIRMTMETAMEHNFTCPECGQVLQEQNNTRTIDNLKTRISELEGELEGKIIESAPKKAKSKKQARRDFRKKLVKKSKKR